MKTSTAILFALITLTSACDAPREKRYMYRGASTSNLANTPAGVGTVAPPGGSTVIDTGTGGTTNTVIPSEISHCSWSMDGTTGFAYTHEHIGAYTVCKSTSSDDIYLQVKNPITDVQLCLFPTTNTGSNSSYIGEARCLMVSDNKKIYKIITYKNRPGYTSSTLTGVMIMKDKAYFYPSPFYQWLLSPDAYVYCSQYLDQYNNSSYCSAFKSLNQYVYRQF
jgi:hypothetical protein